MRGAHSFLDSVRRLLIQGFCAAQVGAVNAQLLTVPWLSVRAIDIRPCLPSIEQADLLMLKPAAEFDVVVCAMVLNCVPTAKDRGSMLLKMRAHLKRSGHAFIVIPLRCLNDSPFMTTASFEQALMAAGLKVHTDSQKLLTYCIQCMLMRISNCSCGRFLYGSAVLGCMPA